jgi:hypothetical protein
MSNIALDASSHDLDLTGHRLNIISGEAAIQQNLTVRLKFFLEEWFLDQRLGIPYFRDILIKNPIMLLVRSIFRNAIASTTGISGVSSLTASINGANRTLSLSFVATMNTGAQLIYNNFIIEI